MGVEDVKNKLKEFQASNDINALKKMTLEDVSELVTKFGFVKEDLPVIREMMCEKQEGGRSSTRKNRLKKKRNKKNSMIILFLNVIYPIENSIYPILISKLVKYIQDFDKQGIIRILSYIVILNVFVVIMYDLGIVTRKIFEASLTSLILEETIKYVFKYERNIDKITNTELILTIKQYSLYMCDYIESFVKIIIPSLFSVFYQMLYLYKVDYYLGNIFLILIFVMISSVIFTNKKCDMKLKNLTMLENSLYEEVDEILINLSTVLNNNEIQKSEIQKLRDITSNIKKRLVLLFSVVIKMYYQVFF